MTNIQKARFNNVQKFKDSVYSDILVFLNNKKNKSENTYRSYKASITDFFMWVYGKSINMLNEQDLSLKNSVFMEYQSFLYNEKKLSSNSTNSKMGAISSLYLFLEKQEYPVKAINAKVENIKNEEDEEQAGELYIGEPEQMAKIALSHKQKGYEKYLLIKMAYTTSLRLSSILKLKWTDINFNTEEQVYVINSIVKGKKKHQIGITVDFYYELEKVKDQNYYLNSDFIFTLSQKTIWSMMQDIKKEMKFEDSRNIVFHSFRNYVSNYSTLEEMKKQLGHSNIQTTSRSYRHKQKGFSNMPSVRMETNIDDKIFEELTKEQLIELITSQPINVKEQLKRNVNNLFK